MSECFYCEDGEKRKSLMIEICRLKYSTVYLNRNQKYRGRCVVKLNDHKTEYFQMDTEERNGYFAETAAVFLNCIIQIKSIMQPLETWFLMFTSMWFPSTRTGQTGEVPLMIHRERLF